MLFKGAFKGLTATGGPFPRLESLLTGLESSKAIAITGSSTLENLARQSLWDLNFPY